MLKSLYSTISENFLKNFLIPLYRGSIVGMKAKVISDIFDRTPFICEYDSDTNIIIFYTGKDELRYELIWKEENHNNRKIYVLKDINDITFD